MKRLFSFIAILSLLVAASCMQDPEADFRAPTVSATCTPGSNYVEVTLTIQVSNKHFKDCGFWYSTTSDLSDKKSLPVSGISGQSTGEARLTGLETGITYYYQAYVNSGRTTVTSSILHFTLDDVMNVDTDGFKVSYPETDLQVRVETTLPITVDLGGADWIEEIQTKGLDIYNKVFHISRNTELASRSATIRIASTNGKFQKDIPVQQSGCPITIPDEVFKAYMVANFDKNGDGEIVVNEAEAVERIDITTDDIVSLGGIEYCIHLKNLICVGTDGSNPYGSGKLAYLDVTHCPELEEIVVYQNELKELDVTHCPKLAYLHPARNLLTSLDLTQNPKLVRLWADNNLLDYIDLSKNPELQSVFLYDNKLKALDVSHNIHLFTLSLGGNQIKAIDFSHNPELSELSLQGEPLAQLPDISSLPLTSLQLSNLVSGQPADFLTHFPNLVSVNISGYDGATLDLSKNTKLRDVYCWDMGAIQVLDLSAAPGLKNLYCAAYDGSGWNKNLKAVYVHSGVVFDVLVKNEATAIYYTDGNNHLNINPSSFEIDYKEQVFTVTVDSDLDVAPDLGDVKWISLYGQTENTLSFKAARNYTTDDRSATFIIRTGNGQLEREVKVTQTGGPIEIPDAVFKQYMVDHFDQDRDGEITPKEALAVEIIDIVTDDISSLKGLEFCIHLKNLRCAGNKDVGGIGSGKLSSINLTYCSELEELRVYHNSLTELDVTHCPKLRELHPACNRLASLDLSHNPELRCLTAYSNQFTEMNLSFNSKLQILGLGNNKITALDISNNPLLKELHIDGNRIKSIDLSHNPEIATINLQGNPWEQLPDIWSLPLTWLWMHGCTPGLPSDFLTHFPNLEDVNISDYDGATLDLSKNTKLRGIWCYSMPNISVLDLSNSPNLNQFHSSGSAKLKSVYLHTGVVFEGLEKDTYTQLYYTDGNDHLTVTPTFLEMDYPEAVFTVTVDSNLDVATDIRGVQWVTPTTIAGQPQGTLAFKVARNYNTESRTATFTILAGGGKLQKAITVNQAAGPIEIPDAAFKQYMVNHFDKDGDNEITPKEASAIDRIDITSNEIVTLKGIEFCTGLRYLKCVGSTAGESYGNGKLSSIDVTHCPDLEELVVYWNELTSLDVSKCPKLITLHPARNLLTSLDLTHNPMLENLWADYNQIKSIDLSNNPKLKKLNLENNKLTSIDVSLNPQLLELIVSQNQIKSIDISRARSLTNLSIQGNPLEKLPDDMWTLPLVHLHISGLTKGLPSDFLTHFPNLEGVNFWDYDGTSIDLSKNTKLRSVWCGGFSNLSVLDLSAAPTLSELYVGGGNPNLKTIYVHSGVEFNALQNDDNIPIIYK